MTGHYPSFGASFVLGTALELLRRKKWQPTPVHLPGKPHEQRSLVGYSPWGHKELDMTEQLHFGASKSSHWASCHIKSTFHCTSQSSQEMVHCCCIEWEPDTTKQHSFFVCYQFIRHPLIECFHFSSLFQMLIDCRMVDVEFLGNFSCSSKRISYDDPLNLSLPTSDGWPLCSSSSRL